MTYGLSLEVIAQDRAAVRQAGIGDACDILVLAPQAQRTLVHLPTKLEVEAKVETIEVFVADVPTRSAHEVLKAIDAAICRSDSADLHHLKRFIKPEDLPSSLKHTHGKQPAEYAIAHCDNGKTHAASLHLLVCPRAAISYERLRTLFLSLAPSVKSGINPNLRTTQVPLSPATSADQARHLSQEYWPITYKGGNPFGPHPALLARAAEEMQGEVDGFMCLAAGAGWATSIARKGEAFGAVVVDRGRSDTGLVIAVAGDARWEGVPEDSRQGNGNPMAHPVMRAINMVARKRRSISGIPLQDTQVNAANSCADEPLTTLEKHVYATSTLTSGGYLCLDLELYVTHEPCSMCSMAINHSRFGRVVFREYTLTGGLSTDKAKAYGTDSMHSAYGLWWRKELNWRFLTWHWAEDNNSQPASVLQSLQSLHA